MADRTVLRGPEAEPEGEDLCRYNGKRPPHPDLDSTDCPVADQVPPVQSGLGMVPFLRWNLFTHRGIWGNGLMIHNKPNGALRKSGYIGVMASDKEQTSLAPVKPGDTIYTGNTLSQVLDRDHYTRQGVGRYYTILYTFRNQDGVVVGTETIKAPFYKPAITTRRPCHGQHIEERMRND